MGRSEFDYSSPRPAWNAGRKVGTKRPLKPRQIWASRFHLDREHRLRDRALFDLAVDSKLRGCDLVKIKIGDLVTGGELRTRAIVVQQKTGRPSMIFGCRSGGFSNGHSGGAAIADKKKRPPEWNRRAPDEDFCPRTRKNSSGSQGAITPRYRVAIGRKRQIVR